MFQLNVGDVMLKMQHQLILYVFALYWFLLYKVISLIKFVWKTCWVSRLFGDIKQQFEDLFEDNGNGYCVLLWLKKIMLQMGRKHIIHQVIT